MEKRTAHYTLSAIQQILRERGVDCFTRSAQCGMREMQLSPEQAIAALLVLEARHLIKSMTTYADARVWQDVYRATTPCGDAYVKFTMRDVGSVVISFKRYEQ